MKTLLRGGRGQRGGAGAGPDRRSPPAEAQLKAVEAQIREQRVTLAYHRVTAPTAGVVGDIPVRVGDSVTRSTVLTTIDQNAGLEVYINVPVQEAQNLRVGLPVQLVDDRGRVLATETVSFVATSVDPATQSVLAKATVETAGLLRTEQFVRAQHRLDGGAGAHRSPGGPEPHQRPVLRLRGRARRRRSDGGPPARGRAGPGGRERLRREVRPQAGREADRLRRAEDPRRLAGRDRRPPRPRPAERASPCSPTPSSAARSSPPSARSSSSWPGAICIPLLPIARYPQLAPPSVSHHRVLHRRQRPGRGERGHHAPGAGRSTASRA